MLCIVAGSSCSELRRNPAYNTLQDSPSGCEAYECHVSTSLMYFPPSSGKHNAHLQENSNIDCTHCHSDYDNNPLHKNGIINGFNSLLNSQATGDIVNFSKNINPNGEWDNTTSMCSNMYCHGDFDWYGAGELSCTGCHLSGGSAPNPLGIAKHAAHIDTDHDIINNINCETCHYNYSNVATHRNGNPDSDNIVYFNPGYPGMWDNGGGTCNSMSCHGDATWSVSATMTCTQCHSSTYSTYHPDPLGVAKHTEHLNTDHGTINDIDCETCHDNYKSSTTHLNGTLNSINIVYFNSVYPGMWDNGASTCSSMNCHGNSTWNSSAVLPCTECHSSSYTAYHPDPTGTAKHTEHLNTNHAVIADIDCNTCHYNYSSIATHIDGTLNSVNIAFFNPSGYPGTWDNDDSTCNNMSCHGDSVWDPSASLNCTQCHASLYDTYHPDPVGTSQGRHYSHALTYGYSCGSCHDSYQGSGTHLDGSNDRLNDTINLIFFLDPGYDMTWNDTGDSCSRGAGSSCHTKPGPGWNTKYW